MFYWHEHRPKTKRLYEAEKNEPLKSIRPISFREDKTQTTAVVQT